MFLLGINVALFFIGMFIETSAATGPIAFVGLASPHLARAASVGTGEAGWALMRWRCRCRGAHTLPVARLLAHTTKDVRVGSQPMIQACAVCGGRRWEKGLEGAITMAQSIWRTVQYCTSQSWAC